MRCMRMQWLSLLPPSSPTPRGGCLRAKRFDMEERVKNDKKLFYEELNKLVMDSRIRRLSKYPQHNGSNTLTHCVQVAKRSFALAEEFGWDIDEKELARGAMLHDYYQYDIKEEGFSAYHHGTSHPLTAMKKAQEDFDLTEKERNIIRGHMWPLTLAHPPKSKEAILVCLADKDIATREFARPEIRKAKKLAEKVLNRKSSQ